MKNLTTITAMLLCAVVSAQTAGDYATFRKAAGVGDVKTYLTPSNNALLGTNGSGAPAFVLQSAFSLAAHTHAISDVTGLQAALDGKVPMSRTITINGVALDLSANRSWTVGDVLTSGSYANPSWITSLAWSKITGTPTTIAGYGITDFNTLGDARWSLLGHTHTLDGLSDVTAPSPSSGQVLEWNGSAWVNGTDDTGGGGTVTGVTGTTPINSSGGTAPVISIDNAAADGSTKGAASFTASDFNASSGNISIDYTNGQAASGSAKGFLTAADWTTFNSKQAAGNYITALTGDVTASGPGSAAATIANDAVTNAKAANMAEATLKGRAAGAGTGDPTDLTPNQASTILDGATDPFLRTSAVTASDLDAVLAAGNDGGGQDVVNIRDVFATGAYANNAVQFINNATTALGAHIRTVYLINATVTLPASPEDGMYVDIHANGGVDCFAAGNGNLIEGSATYTIPATQSARLHFVSGGWYDDNRVGPLGLAEIFPDQSGHSGEFLTTDGSNVSWAAASGGGISDGDVLGIGLTFPNAGLKYLDIGGDHELILSTPEDFAADRTLNIRLGDADRQLRLTGDAIIQGTNTGDQTSIVGITGTLAEFNTAVSDANLVPEARTITTTSPLAGGGDLSTNRTLSIANAAADGSTKGAASFTANDFDASSGNISIDYTNGQAASGSAKGFLTSADWTTFNSKQAVGNYITALTGDVTASGPGSAAATIANDAVTNAKAANMAQSTLKGRAAAAGTGDPTDLTPNEVSTILDGATDPFTRTSALGSYVSDGDVLSAGLTFQSTGGLNIWDAATDHILTFRVDDDFSADRALRLILNDDTRTLTISGDADITGTNTGDQTITNSSDATSHTVTLSASGGSVQLIEGSNITLTTGGSASAGTVTIAATGGSFDAAKTLAYIAAY